MQKFFLAVSRSISSAAAVAARSSCAIAIAVLLISRGVSADSAFISSEQSDSDWDGVEIDLARDIRPVVYLTFDDGPSADFVTDELLRLLAKHQATATFFVTGQRVQREQEKIAEIVYAGHAIGNHTVNHAKLTLVSDEEVVSELRGASNIILAAGGPPPTCFRPPFGSTDRRINKLAGSLGMVPVGWSIDTRDWERTISVDAIASALNRTSEDSVVLLHDGPSYRIKMLQALTRWMAANAHKYRFAALPECTPHGGTTYLASVNTVDTTETPAVDKTSATGALVVASTASTASTISKEPAPAVVADSSPALVPERSKTHTIPELLEKIRAYRIVLHDDGQRVDLTQVTATLSSEIHGDHTYFSF